MNAVTSTRGELPVSKIRDYVLAGHATLTIENPETGNRFTFRIDAPTETTDRGGFRREVESETRFVSVLSGPNNDLDYMYIGFLRKTDFRAGRKGRPEAPSFKAFSWVWNHVLAGRSIGPVVAYHEGRCGRCGRKLTVPESIESGLGPVCRGEGR